MNELSIMVCKEQIMEVEGTLRIFRFQNFCETVKNETIYFFGWKSNRHKETKRNGSSCMRGAVYKVVDHRILNLPSFL